MIFGEYKGVAIGGPLDGRIITATAQSFYGSPATPLNPPYVWQSVQIAQQRIESDIGVWVPMGQKRADTRVAILGGYLANGARAKQERIDRFTSEMEALHVQEETDGHPLDTHEKADVLLCNALLCEGYGKFVTVYQKLTRYFT